MRAQGPDRLERTTSDNDSLSSPIRLLGPWCGQADERLNSVVVVLSRNGIRKLNPIQAGPFRLGKVGTIGPIGRNGILWLPRFQQERHLEDVRIDLADVDGFSSQKAFMSDQGSEPIVVHMWSQFVPGMCRGGDLPQRAEGEAPRSLLDDLTGEWPGGIQRQPIFSELGYPPQLLAAIDRFDTPITEVNDAFPLPRRHQPVDTPDQPGEIAAFD